MSNQFNNHIEMHFPSLGENVGLARLVVASMASLMEFTVDEVEEIKVAVSEGVSNAIIHGYLNETDKIVHFNVARYNDELIIEIVDDGVGIADIEQATKPSYSSVAERMGLGFVFMQSFMDSVDIISSPQSGTKITMRKKKNING